MPCKINNFSPRVCEKGTKGCIIEHEIKICPLCEMEIKQDRSKLVLINYKGNIRPAHKYCQDERDNYETL